MVQLIPLALIALASFTAAVPITAPKEVSPMMEATMPSSYVFPLNWKRDHLGNNKLNEILESLVIQALSKENTLMKRQSDSPFELESLFRGLFDKIISHIIEVTPLNGIVHGNYDLLYSLFTDKISEAIAGIGQSVDQAPGPVLPPFNLFGSPDQAPAPGLPSLNPFGSPEPTDSDVVSTPDAGTPFDFLGGLGSLAPPTIPDIFNIGKGKDSGKSSNNEKNYSNEDEECDEDEDDEDEESEDDDSEDEDSEDDSDDEDCDDEDDEDDEEEDYKRKWKNHMKKHHHHKK